MPRMKADRATGGGSGGGRSRIIPLTPVRAGHISDSRYAKTVTENLARIQARKQSRTARG